MRVAAFFLLLITTTAAAGRPGPPEPPLAIRNAVVETLGAAGRIERATVLVRDAKIAAIGKDVAIPDDATVIDAGGGTLMPGLIDPHFTVSVAAATADTGPRTTIIRGRPVTLPGGFGQRGGGGFTRVADNFYPYDPGFKPLPRVGLTRLNLVTSGVGQAAIVKVTPTQPEQMLAQADGLAYATVTNSTESLDQIRTRLTRGGGAGRAGGFGGGAPAPGAQLWNDVLDGKTPLVVEAANSAAVIHLLKALESHKKVKLALFASGDTVAETLPALLERKPSVLLRPRFDLLPNSRDRFSAARMLHEAGIEFAFTLTARPPTGALGGGIGAAGAAEDTTQTLNIDPDFPLFPVAMLVKAGLPREAALKALTTRPAALLGLDKAHGTIEPGKAADLLLFTGDPLDPASRLRHTIIDGRVTYAY
jgi:hypothetical protein